jgi:ferritin-like metal-binding protein YciE
MTETTKRDLKLVQYLNEAYATERRLEIALQAHIAMTPRRDYKTRLKEHLNETKAHARDVARRIQQLGGEAETVSMPGPEPLARGVRAAQTAVQQAAAAAQAPLHAVRGTGQQERMLKNARTEFQDEAEEIATYRAIEGLAKAVGDKETAKLVREIQGEEQRMADFLAGIIDQLALDVVHDEIPVSEINGPGARRVATKTSGAPRATPRSKPAAAGRSRAASKPASRAASKPASRAASKPAGRAASKPAGRAASKPAGAASKPAGRAASKPAGRAASKPAGRAASKPATGAASKSKPARASRGASRAKGS